MIFRNDLTLWKAFAEIEWLSGNTDEARRVFDSTLMMGGEMFSDEQDRRTALAPLVWFDQLFHNGFETNSVIFLFSVRPVSY